jgi:hypothetical protein
MKPRIRLAGGVWSCTTYRIVDGYYRFRMGMGYSIKEAFEDWLEQEFA